MMVLKLDNVTRIVEDTKKAAELITKGYELISADVPKKKAQRRARRKAETNGQELGNSKN